MKYDTLKPIQSPHAEAVRAQRAACTLPYPAQIYDAHCDNVYRFVRTGCQTTLRAGYSLSGDDSEGLFWYSRGVRGRLCPLYGAPHLAGESKEKVAARPAM